MRPEPDDPTDAARIELVAVRQLARREYAARELEDKLVQRGFDADAVAGVVRSLSERGLQDDARFAEAFVRSRVARGHGPVKVTAELKRRGVADTLSRDAVSGGADWFALAAGERQRRFGDAPPGDWEQRARQARFLEQRGFTHDQIKAAVDGHE